MNLAARVFEVANAFMSQLETGQYSSQWGELSSVAQGQWPSEAARTQMLATKFQGDAQIVSYSVGAMTPGATWVSREDPAQSVAGVVDVPVKVSFADPLQMQPAGVVADYTAMNLVLVAAGSGPPLVVGEGPASLDAPLIDPIHPKEQFAPVPILMYHVVAPFPVRSQWNSQYAYALEYGLTVTPAQFAAQMAVLQAAQAHAISLTRLADFLLYGLPLPSHPVVITFDDGRQSPYQYAVPVLQHYGYTATFFVPTGLVGKFVTTETGTNPQHYMSWTEIDQLAKAGFWVEDHTLKDNVALWELGANQVGQLAGSTALTLAQQTGVPVQFIAYTGLWPYPTATQVGPHEARLFSELQSLGYVGGAVDARTDSALQSTAEIWQMPRVRMNPNEPGSQLAPWIG